MDTQRPLRAAEFFAGIGLVRRALEESDIRVVFANDIDPVKRTMYEANFGAADFHLRDIAELGAHDIPDVDIATASFPCTDVSLAGNRAGLDGPQSGTFWMFADILDSLGPRRPPAILMENVAGLGTSRQGADLRAAIVRLNGLGYSCDLVQLDARRWLPQSRPRVFVVGSQEVPSSLGDWGPDDLRPAWITKFVDRNPDLEMCPALLRLPDASSTSLECHLEHMSDTDPRWWETDRASRFVASLSEIQGARLRELQSSPDIAYRTAYRRTRRGRPVWEIRADAISGCLRTARGGSSRQALLEVGQGSLRIRWMTAREYASLMGAQNHHIDIVSENQAIFGLGDAVCVPAVSWLVRAYLVGLLRGGLKSNALVTVGAG
jgi:DNA (cytosine-5)-methyltransferase 1